MGDFASGNLANPRVLDRYHRDRFAIQRDKFDIEFRAIAIRVNLGANVSDGELLCRQVHRALRSPVSAPLRYGHGRLD